MDGQNTPQAFTGYELRSVTERISQDARVIEDVSVTGPPLSPRSLRVAAAPELTDEYTNVETLGTCCEQGESDETSPPDVSEEEIVAKDGEAGTDENLQAKTGASGLQASGEDDDEMGKRKGKPSKPGDWLRSQFLPGSQDGVTASEEVEMTGAHYRPTIPKRLGIETGEGVSMLDYGILPRSRTPSPPAEPQLEFGPPFPWQLAEDGHEQGPDQVRMSKCHSVERRLLIHPSAQLHTSRNFLFNPVFNMAKASRMNSVPCRPSLSSLSITSISSTLTGSRLFFRELQPADFQIRECFTIHI